MSLELLDPGAEALAKELDRQKRIDEYEKSPQSIDEKVRNAIRRYTGDDYLNFKNFQPDHYSFKQQCECLFQDYSLIEEYLNLSTLSENIRLYRGTATRYFGTVFNKDYLAAFLYDCTILGNEELTKKYGNRIFRYDQLISTSTDLNIACGFSDYPDPCILEIYAPAGTNGMDISTLSTNSYEKEILLPSTEMQLDKITRTGSNSLYVNLSVVNNCGEKQCLSPQKQK